MREFCTLPVGVKVFRLVFPLTPSGSGCFTDSPSGLSEINRKSHWGDKRPPFLGHCPGALLMALPLGSGLLHSV